MTERKSKSLSVAPWKTPGGSQWLATFQAWKQMRRLIQATLLLDPTDHAHEIRAAAAMVIMFCREGLWPVGERETFEPVIELAARQLSHVKQLYETKGRIKPQLQANRQYRLLLRSLDEEVRILEARIADPKPKMPNQAPCTWGEFWN